MLLLTCQKIIQYNIFVILFFLHNYAQYLKRKGNNYEMSIL